MSVFSYRSKTLEELKVMYNDMKDIGVSIGSFSHEYNKIKSSVIFDTQAQKWKLSFIQYFSGKFLEVPIESGYRFTIDGNENYQNFIEYFQVGGGKGKFSIKDFMAHFQKFVPTEYKLNDKRRMDILRYGKWDNDGIYPIGIVNWQMVHANRPDLQDDKYHRSEKNLMKTKELYPVLYKATKNQDIIIRYGDKPNNQSADIQVGKIGDMHMEVG